MSDSIFHLIVISLVATIALLCPCHSQYQAADTVDPCDKPLYCMQPGGEVAHDSGNCSLFYRCDNAYWIEMPCSNGTLFDTNSSGCIHAANASCQLACPTEEPITGTIPEFGGTCTPIHDPCTDEDRKYPDSLYCEKYWWCYQSSLVIMDCASGYLFDLDTEECEVFYNVDCDIRCPETKPTSSPLTTISIHTSAEPATDITTVKQTTDATAVIQTTDATAVIQTTDATAVIQTTDATAVIQTTDATAVIQTTDATSVIQTTDATTVIQTTAATTVKQTTDATTVLQTTDATSVIQTTDATTVIQTTDATTVKQTTDATAVLQTTDATTVKHSTDATTVKQTTDATTVLQTTDATTVKHSTDAITIKQTTDATTVLQTTDVITVKQTTDVSTFPPSIDPTISSTDIITSTPQNLPDTLSTVPLMTSSMPSTVVPKGSSEVPIIAGAITAAVVAVVVSAILIFYCKQKTRISPENQEDKDVKIETENSDRKIEKENSDGRKETSESISLSGLTSPKSLLENNHRNNLPLPPIEDKPPLPHLLTQSTVHSTDSNGRFHHAFGQRAPLPSIGQSKDSPIVPEDDISPVDREQNSIVDMDKAPLLPLYRNTSVPIPRITLPNQPIANNTLPPIVGQSLPHQSLNIQPKEL